MNFNNTNNVKPRRFKIAIVHPKLAKGGSEQRVLWVVSALKDDYDTSLITGGKVDIQQLNKYYGTNLDQKEFTIIQVPLPFWLEKSRKFAALKGRFIQRYCQYLAPNFDLMISTYNICSFGVRGIQFTADFSFEEEFRKNIDLVPPNWKKWYHKDTIFRKIYLKFCDWISPFNPVNWKNDLIVANSNWMAGLMRQKYGVKTRIAYPPVVGNFPSVPYENREQGFICIGRIVPERRIDMIIKILEKVRQKGHDVHLHILGSIENNDYGRNLLELFKENQEWVFPEGLSEEQKKKDIIKNHRFGISGCKNEGFGIAVAEMVKGGCIVFVPDGGGQVEIVEHPDLIYKNVEDAVQKIETVLKDKQMQEYLLKRLSVMSQKFSVENFQKEVKNIVSDFLKEKYAL